MRELNFQSGEYYHIYLRGADKRRIFFNDSDRELFVEYMYLFNDARHNYSIGRYEKIAKVTGSHLFSDERDPFVSIISWTLLPNHYHVFVRQEKENGISKFLHKLNKAYSWKFNRRYDRVGTLFEGPFHAIHVNNEAYFNHIIVYIHNNILDLTSHGWRDGVVNDWHEALRFMDDYRWSSHQYYRSDLQEFAIVDEILAKQMFESSGEYTNAIEGWSTRDLPAKYLEKIVTW